MPIAPPVSVSQSWRGRAGSRPGDEESRRVSLVHHDGPFGQHGPHGVGEGLGRERARRPLGPPGRGGRAGVGRRTDSVGQRRQGARGVLAGPDEGVHRAAGRHQVARLAGVGEEGDRGGSVDQDQVPDAVELRLGHFGQVGQPVDGRDARPTFQVGRECLAQQEGAAHVGDPAGGVQPGRAERTTAEQEGSPLTRAQGLGHLVDRVVRHHRRPSPRTGRAGARGGLGPRGVGRQYQGRHAARRAERRGNGVRPVSGDVVRPCRRAVPARHRTGDGGDLRLERRVVAGVVGGVVAHDVDDRRAGSSRVVQVGQPVAEPGPEVEQRRRRTACHASVAVRGTGDDALEEAEHAAHGRHVVQRSHEVHLRSPRIGEADVDPGIDQRREE